MTELILESGDWHARVLPEAGGLIAALTHAGIPILRTMQEGSTQPLDAACFPMVPWCNRIADARFDWEGETITLVPNFRPEPHAIHGHGWLAAWTVAQAAADSCTLAYRHPAGAAGWPWAYEATQQIALSPEGCAMTLTLTNLDDRAMPAGLGFHPYFRRSAESCVRFSAGPICEVGSDMIPTGRMLSADSFGAFGASEGAALPAYQIDHCYTDWDSAAVVSDADGSIAIAATGAAHLHLYAPQLPGILCLEPASHLPDALNRDPASMHSLQPGASLTTTMMISTEPRR